MLASRRSTGASSPIHSPRATRNDTSPLPRLRQRNASDLQCRRPTERPRPLLCAPHALSSCEQSFPPTSLLPHKRTRMGTRCRLRHFICRNNKFTASWLECLRCLKMLDLMVVERVAHRERDLWLPEGLGPNPMQKEVDRTEKALRTRP